MEERLAIKKTSSVLCVFGLVLLFLLSPCKVRNFIQVELKISQTKTLNKSQSAIYQLNCSTFEVSETIQNFSKSHIQQAYFPISRAYSFGFIVDLPKRSLPQTSSRSQLASDVPLYILHQNIQVYS